LNVLKHLRLPKSSPIKRSSKEDSHEIASAAHSHPHFFLLSSINLIADFAALSYIYEFLEYFTVLFFLGSVRLGGSSSFISIVLDTGSNCASTGVMLRKPEKFLPSHSHPFDPQMLMLPIESEVIIKGRGCKKEA